MLGGQPGPALGLLEAEQPLTQLPDGATTEDVAARVSPRARNRTGNQPASVGSTRPDQ